MPRIPKAQQLPAHQVIPTPWFEQHHALHVERMAQIEQVKDGTPLKKGVKPITDADFDALWKTPVTAAELKKHASSWRGIYTTKDSRGFIREHEQQLRLHNCWMLRNKKDVQFISEPPATYLARQKRKTKRGARR